MDIVWDGITKAETLTAEAAVISLPTLRKPPLRSEGPAEANFAEQWGGERQNRRPDACGGHGATVTETP
jgi:hypothetical protein